MLKEKFCDTLFDQYQVDVSPALNKASKNYLDQLGKRLLVRFCEQRNPHLMKCIEKIVEGLDGEARVRESLGPEFALLYKTIKCKQGNYELFSAILNSKVSTRYFKGIFSYLWPETILGKFYCYLINFRHKKLG